MFFKIKSWFQLYKYRILIGAVLLLAVTAAFGLGWLLRGEVKRTPIIIEKYSTN